MHPRRGHEKSLLYPRWGRRVIAVSELRHKTPSRLFLTFLQTGRPLPDVFPARGRALEARAGQVGHSRSIWVEIVSKLWRKAFPRLFPTFSRTRRPLLDVFSASGRPLEARAGRGWSSRSFPLISGENRLGNVEGNLVGLFLTFFEPVKHSSRVSRALDAPRRLGVVGAGGNVSFGAPQNGSSKFWSDDRNSIFLTHN